MQKLTCKITVHCTQYINVFKNWTNEHYIFNQPQHTVYQLR